MLWIDMDLDRSGSIRNSVEMKANWVYCCSWRSSWASDAELHLYVTFEPSLKLSNRSCCPLWLVSRSDDVEVASVHTQNSRNVLILFKKPNKQTKTSALVPCVAITLFFSFWCYWWCCLCLLVLLISSQDKEGTH